MHSDIDVSTEAPNATFLRKLPVIKPHSTVAVQGSVRCLAQLASALSAAVIAVPSENIDSLDPGIETGDADRSDTSSGRLVPRLVKVRHPVADGTC